MFMTSERRLQHRSALLWIKPWNCGDAIKIEKLPLVDDDFNLMGLITIKEIEKTSKYPNSAKDKKGRLLAAARGWTAKRYF
jgi:hypothetical protein